MKYTYPNGKKSPIIYIGKSDDLLRRLKDEHYIKGLKRLIDNPDWGIDENKQLASKYQYMYYDGSHVDVFKCRGKQESKEMESMFLNQFYQKYRALPVGNGARSYGKNGAYSQIWQSQQPPDKLEVNHPTSYPTSSILIINISGTW